MTISAHNSHQVLSDLPLHNITPRILIAPLSRHLSDAASALLIPSSNRQLYNLQHRDQKVAKTVEVQVFNNPLREEQNVLAITLFHTVAAGGFLRPGRLPLEPLKI